jgi:hypothetical protein
VAAISELMGVWGAYLSFAFRNPLPASVRQSKFARQFQYVS